MSNKKVKRGLEEFFKLHPKVDPGVIGAAYVSCRGKWAECIFAAYDHVQKCPRCQNWMKEQEGLDEITKPSPREIEERIKRMPEVLGLVAKQ